MTTERLDLRARAKTISEAWTLAGPDLQRYSRRFAVALPWWHRQPHVFRELLDPAERTTVAEVGAEVLRDHPDADFAARVLAAVSARAESALDPEDRCRLRHVVQVLSAHVGQMEDLRQRLALRLRETAGA